uniref:Transmembrane protein 218-like n=1 Tax=Labrus bergylta TaxID=56723 RepID=A0A3Q3FPJ4_9LABR
MGNSVSEVGTGIIIIALVWIAASVLGVIPVFLLALSITLALVFFPRSPETTIPLKEIEIVDTLFIGRYILLAVASLVFLVAFFMLLPFHLLEPVHAKALRTH